LDDVINSPRIREQNITQQKLMGDASTKLMGDASAGRLKSKRWKTLDDFFVH